jgi:mutator protein MutT
MRHTYPLAIHLFFFQNNQVLLLRRFNTGYEDGNYSVPAGHVEAGESAIQCAVREAREEAGVELKPQHIVFAHAMHRKSDDERVNFFFVVTQWHGEITNTEPHKCDDLSWHPLDSLPHNVIPYVRHALKQVQEGNAYSELNWARSRVPTV